MSAPHHLPAVSPRYMRGQQHPTTTTTSSKKQNTASSSSSNSSSANRHLHHQSSTLSQSEQEIFLSKLNLDVYRSIKSSLIIEEHHQRVKELKEILTTSLGTNKNDQQKSSTSSSSSTSTSSIVSAQKRLIQKQQAAKDVDGNGGKISITSNEKKTQAEVQSLRREQNETLARREQLKVWVDWLRSAVKTFASPAAAVESFVQRTHELCVEGVNADQVVPNDFDQVVENQVLRALGRSNSHHNRFQNVGLQSAGVSRAGSRRGSLIFQQQPQQVNNNNSNTKINTSAQDVKNIANSSMKMWSNLDASEKHHRLQLRGGNMSTSAVTTGSLSTARAQHHLPSETYSSSNTTARLAKHSTQANRKPFSTLPTSSPSSNINNNNKINSPQQQRLMFSDVELIEEGSITLGSRAYTPQTQSQTQSQQTTRNISSNNDQNDDDDNEANPPIPEVKCEVLASLASLIALLTLAEVWSSEAASGASMNQGIISSRENHTTLERVKNLRLLIRSIVDDMASGIFFSPPSMGCSTPEDVVSNLGGARAFSDVFNDMLSVAVFHRDRAEACRYLEVRRETVLNRCIDNFRREHTRQGLRVWRLYTAQRVRQRKRVWEKLLRHRDLQAVKNAISVWKNFSTHVHLANMMTANKRIQQVMNEIRSQHAHHRSRIEQMEKDREAREVDKQEAQVKFDEVEVKNTRSREKHLSATRAYIELRRKWTEVIGTLFNDDLNVDEVSQSEMACYLTSSSNASPSASVTSSFASLNYSKSHSQQQQHQSLMMKSNNNKNKKQKQQWLPAKKGINWAKWMLHLYSPESLKEWERDTFNLTKLKRSGRFAERGGDLDDRLGDLPFVSLKSVKSLLSVMVSLHKRYFEELKMIGKNLFPSRSNKKNNNNRISTISDSAKQNNKEKVESDNENDQIDNNNDHVSSSSIKIAKMGASGMMTIAKNNNSAAATTIGMSRQQLADEIWNLYDELCRVMELTYHQFRRNEEEERTNQQQQQQNRQGDNQEEKHEITTTNDEAPTMVNSPTGIFSSAANFDDEADQESSPSQSASIMPTTTTGKSLLYKYDYKTTGRPWKIPIPPISISDLLRQDQLRLVMFILHLAQIWTGGFAGTFFGKKKGDAHDRHAVVYNSRLSKDPKQGQMSVIEETEDMSADWSFCMKKFSALTHSTEFEAAFEDGVRESIENGESQNFRQGLQHLFELLTLGNSITKQRMEMLLLCLRSEAAKGTLDSWGVIHGKMNDGNNNLKNNKNNDGYSTDLKIRLPTWPPTGISSKTDLGLYITLAADVLGYQRRHLCDELCTLLLQSAETAFAYSVFVPSDGLRAELTRRSTAINEVFNRFAAVSRTGGNDSNSSLNASSSLKKSAAGRRTVSPQHSQNRTTSPSTAISPTRRNQQQQKQQQQMSSGEPTLVFSKKSYFKWIEEEVAKYYPEQYPSTSGSSGAEALYQSSLNYAPERDRVLLEFLVCATASYIYPSPYEDLEAKVKKFCERVLFLGSP